MDPGEASLAWQPSSIPTQLQKLILADSVWFVLSFSVLVSYVKLS
jgi:hypothetical protein